jgi:hypothetical protein
MEKEHDLRVGHDVARHRIPGPRGHVDPAAVRDEPQGDDVGVPFRRKRGDAQDHRTVDEEADRAVVGCSLRHACRISP